MKRSLFHFFGSAVLALGVLFTAPVLAQANVTHDPDNGINATLQTIDGGGGNSLGPSGGSTSTSLTGNTITLASGEVNKVYGASNTSSNTAASGNQVFIQGGTASGNVYGGSINRSVFTFSASVAASNNTVTIEGGTLNSGVYGGRASIGGGAVLLSATASSNTVIIQGNPVFGANVRLYGGVAIVNNASLITPAASSNNTLEFRSVGLSVVEAANFQRMNFHLPEALENGGTMLTVTGTAATNLTGVAFGVDLDGDGPTNMAVGNTYTLIQGVQGSFATIGNTFSNGFGYQVRVEAGNLILEVTSEPPTFGIWHNVMGGGHDFGVAVEGYAAGSITPLTVKVKNIGNQPTGELTIALSGDNAASFTLSSTTIDSLNNYKDKDNFTVAPNHGLAVGTYEATVTISSANTEVTSISFTVSFEVKELVHAQAPSITANPQGATYTVGDTATALAVTASSPDGGTLTYEWFSNTTDSNTGGTSVGTDETYTPNTADVGTTYYYVVVTNTNSAATGNQTASATSNTAEIVVTRLAPRTFQGAFSRKVHGDVGTFDLPINPTDSLDSEGITVEPRSGGAGGEGEFTVVFLFDDVVSTASATLTGQGTVIATMIVGNEVIVSLAGVPDMTRLGIALTVDGIEREASTASANIGFLMGDVNGNGVVNQTDASWVRSQDGESLSEDNFFLDLNANGVINQTDVSLVRSADGNTLP